jgi:NADH dehydrogenase
MGRARVVIIGGGFGGLYAARALARADVDVVIVDRRNHHLFQPLLYQVATAGLNPSDIARPIRSILAEQENAEVVLGEVTAIDRAQRRVVLADGDALEYDHLIVAAGATHSYFGHDDWAPLAPGLKSIEDALDIRRRMLWAYEAAEREPDPHARDAWLTFVIVGAGPTGVEMAGAMAEVGHHTLRRDFRHIDPLRARVLLVEGLDRVLPAFAPALAPKARRQLEKLGVAVLLGKRVTTIDAEGVTLVPSKGGDPERIPARTVMWAAGISASPLGKLLGVATDRAGRVLVEKDLGLPGDERVFVIGDLAAMPADADGKPVPGLAPAAMQEGRLAAKNLLRRRRGERTVPFRYLDKGSLATIGRAAAVGSVGKLTLSGFVAWFTWAFVHLLYLSGFRNRFFVFWSWGWSYVTYTRGARLITGLEPRLLHAPPPAPPPPPPAPPP